MTKQNNVDIKCQCQSEYISFFVGIYGALLQILYCQKLHIF